MAHESEESPPVPEVRRIRCRSEVKWFDNRRGFGFIVSPEGKDVFVHYSKIRQEGFRTLRNGSQVEYTPVQGEKGLYAEDVIVVALNPSGKGSKSKSRSSPEPPRPESETPSGSGSN